MTSNGGGDRGLQQVNHHHVKEENGTVGDGWGLYRDGELRVDKSNEDVKDQGGEAVQGEFVVHAPQLQPQGTLVQWEKFLHVRSIKVMLVENDDSTRHIVTALLRNCNYEVIEAANGLQAWKILEDLTNHIDIVLTEVAMPVVSGVGLLCKIMSHQTRKSIPVIMMSSHDSMGLVFKCLSKGAVDFLVKPIRKNELKNLWQHVWRRCQSSCGSGSESFTETQKSVKSRSSLRSDNNSCSNDGEDSSSNGLNTGDGSDDGSGAQSSWTKQAVDVDSSQAASQRGQKAECPDSTCGQVIRSNAEAPGTRDTLGQQELNNVAKGKGLAIGKSRNSDMLHESQNSLQELDPAMNSKRKDQGRENRSRECSSHKHTAAGRNTADSQRDGGEFEERAYVEIKNIVTDDSNEGAVEHSLKRFREVKDMDKTVQYDRIVSRHSEVSAFSRYNTDVHAFKAPNRIRRSSSQLDGRLEITKKESTFNGRSCSDGYFATPSSEGNMGFTTDKLRTNPVFQKDNGVHPSYAFRPIKTDIRATSQKVLPGKVDDMTLTSILDPRSGPHSELPIQHIHHHHHVHHFHDMEEGHQLVSSPDDLSLKKLAADASHCGSSNVLGGVSRPVEYNPGDYSFNRSVSGSKHGSNGQNGSSTVINAGGGTNVESIVGVAQKSGNADDSGSGSRNGINKSKSAQREAALIKFRQKRKERYFQKKVRYQNRKRLAEQRPRIRGQFIRQTDHGNSRSGPDS